MTSVWFTSVSVLTVALHKFASALLRQNPHYPHSSPLRVIIGFQSTRPLTPLSSNLTVHKQIFVAAETAASEAAACSGVCGSFIKRAQYIWTVGWCRMWMTWNLAPFLPAFCALHCKTTGVIFTAEAICASVFARCGCHGKDSEMFGSGGCFCGLRVKWA